MTEKTIVIALDINNESEGYQAFRRKTAAEQIDVLADRIDVICKELDDSDALVIFAWREYAITEGLESRVISNEMKAYLKTRMHALIANYPHIVILGSVASYKRAPYKKLAEIKAIYRNDKKLRQLKYIESLSTADQQQIKNLELEMAEIESKHPNFINVVRNTCESFQGAKTRLQQHGKQLHDKFAPFGETDAKRINFEHAVFHPSTGHRRNAYIHLRHPATKRRMVFGVEICREHGYRLLQDTNPKAKLDAHFLLSDTTYVNLDHVQGDHLIQLDSSVTPKLVTLKPTTPRNIILYKNNVCVPTSTLFGPLRALYPFELRVRDEFRRAIQAFPWWHNRRFLLEKMRDDFYFIATTKFQTKKLSSQKIYEKLERILQANKRLLLDPPKRSGIATLMTEKFDQLSISIYCLFGAPDPMIAVRSMYERLSDLINTEKALHPRHKDICA